MTKKQQVKQQINKQSTNQNLAAILVGTLWDQLLPTFSKILIFEREHVEDTSKRRRSHYTVC